MGIQTVGVNQLLFSHSLLFSAPLCFSLCLNELCIKNNANEQVLFNKTTLSGILALSNLSALTFYILLISSILSCFHSCLQSTHLWNLKKVDVAGERWCHGFPPGCFCFSLFSSWLYLCTHISFLPWNIFLIENKHWFLAEVQKSEFSRWSREIRKTGLPHRVK